MKLALRKKRTKVVSVVPIAEISGKDRDVACELKLEATVANDVLEELSPSLKSFLYVKDEASRDLISQDDPEHITHLRFPDLVQPLRWDGKGIDTDVTIHLGGQHNLQLDLCTVKGLRIEALEGGFVVLTFVVHAYPEDGQFEALCKLVGCETEVTMKPEEMLV